MVPGSLIPGTYLIPDIPCDQVMYTLSCSY